jgi:serine/threonine protein kinase
MSQSHSSTSNPPPGGDPSPVMRQESDSLATSDSQNLAVPTEMPPLLVGNHPGALAGHTFGDFELIEEVGRGGMGVVYKAYQKSLERPVALKLLRAEHASKAQVLTRFLTEARAAARLTHPNIISIYQVGEDVAGPYFVMEFIDGPSLELLLKRTLPVNWSVALMSTVTAAVQHAHEMGIIHRDLKPGNIMLHQHKRPVVMDFGIAKVVKSDSAGLTAPGTVMGTPAYMAPEQADRTLFPIGPYTDVYALGALLYTLLTGRVVYDEGSPLKTIVRLLAPEPPPAVRSLRAEVPARLERIVMKCLRKDPSRRYPSARALLADLKRIRGNRQGGASSIKVTLPKLMLIGPEGQQVRLFQATTVVGRAPECDLVLKSSEVSKRHCCIQLSLDSVAVEDLGSVNGTYVNGKQIQRANLHHGDQLDIAGHVFTVRLGTPPRS